MLARANKPCSVCLGSKLDRADVMRGRLRVIRAAAPTGFRYCCARGIPNRPAAPAKKLQRFETLRLLWRRDSVCSNSTPYLAPVRPNESFTTHLRCLLVWAAMATGSPSIARGLVLLGGHDAAPTLPTLQLALHRLAKAVGWLCWEEPPKSSWGDLSCELRFIDVVAKAGGTVPASTLRGAAQVWFRSSNAVLVP
mgnify:CR=1 FL=1